MTSCKEDVAVTGHIAIEIIRDGKNGPEVIQRHETHNLVVDIGKLQVLRKAVGLNDKDFKYFRLGSSSQTPAAGDSNLITPIADSLVEADSRTVSGVRSVQLAISYGSGAGSLSGNIREVAILNELTTPGGHLLARGIFAADVPKTTADKLKVAYTFRVT
jgi:hypothetical protein